MLQLIKFMSLNRSKAMFNFCKIKLIRKEDPVIEMCRLTNLDRYKILSTKALALIRFRMVTGMETII